MIFKSLIAGTVLSVVAGTVVYYGTDIEPQSSETLQAAASSTLVSEETLAGGQLHPHESSNKTKGAGGKAFKPKAEKKADKSQKWVDDYVKPEKDAKAPAQSEKASVETAPALEDESQLRDEANAQIDTMLFDLLEEEQAPVPSKQASVETAPALVDDNQLRDEAKSEIDTMMFDLLEAEAPTEDAAMAAKTPQEPSIKEIIAAPQQAQVPKLAHKNDQMSCSAAKTHSKAERMHKPERMHKKAHRKAMHQCSPAQVSATIELITQQALKIELPELRDRAYLDLVSFALKHKDYDSARAAIDGIDQVELRDTARNRMAIAYAKHGQAEAAFELLEELEVEALSDVIRLQVIESIISPESLPMDHQ